VVTDGCCDGVPLQPPRESSRAARSFWDGRAPAASVGADRDGSAAFISHHAMIRVWYTHTHETLLGSCV
jgi:hypothetical protein